MSWTQEQMTMLIEEIEKRPCLYATKGPAYHNRVKRTMAFQKICDTLSHIRENIAPSDVQKKWTNMRNTYSTERRRYLDSVKSGAAAEDIYTPTLWYYGNMRFLNDHMVIRGSTATTLSQGEASTSASAEAVAAGPMMVASPLPSTSTEYSVQEMSPQVMSPQPTSEDTFVMSPGKASGAPQGKRKRRSVDVVEKRVQESLDALSSVTASLLSKVETPEETFARNLSVRLSRIQNYRIKLETYNRIDNIVSQAELADHDLNQ